MEKPVEHAVANVSPNNWSPDEKLKGFSTPDVLLTVQFRVVSEGRIFTRTVYSILSWMSDIGGLYGLVGMMFAFVVGWYNDKVYLFDAVAANFKIRSKIISR
jgi:hypothetical protein